VNCLSLSFYDSADLSSPGSVAWGSSAGKSVPCCGRLLNAVGRPGFHQSGLTSICFTDCPFPGLRRNGLTIYWALGPLMRSFTLPVDPGISVPHRPLKNVLYAGHCSSIYMRDESPLYRFTIIHIKVYISRLQMISGQ
jgi:hypothetical protein